MMLFFLVTRQMIDGKTTLVKGDDFLQSCLHFPWFLSATYPRYAPRPNLLHSATRYKDWPQADKYNDAPFVRTSINIY